MDNKLLINKENWQRILDYDAHVYLRPTFLGKQDNFILISDELYNHKHRYITKIPNKTNNILNNTYDARYKRNIQIGLRDSLGVSKNTKDLYTYLDNDLLVLSQGLRVNINTKPNNIRDTVLSKLI